MISIVTIHDRDVLTLRVGIFIINEKRFEVVMQKLLEALNVIETTYCRYPRIAQFYYKL